MGMTDKIKNLFSRPNDDYDAYEGEDYEVEDEMPRDIPSTGNTASSFRPGRTASYGTAQHGGQMKVVIVAPKSYEDSQDIASNLREVRPVVINFENTDPHEAARIVDFISGATYALDGKLEKIGKNIFICVPNNISVDHNDKAFSELSADGLTWKGPNA